MKYRQDAASYTFVDKGIWLYVCSVLAARHRTSGFMRACCKADRRDADLMYSGEFRKARPECRGTLSVAGMVSTEIELLGFAELL
jgi:hypothetical protein